MDLTGQALSLLLDLTPQEDVLEEPPTLLAQIHVLAVKISLGMASLRWLVEHVNVQSALQRISAAAAPKSPIAHGLILRELSDMTPLVARTVSPHY